MQSGVSFSGLLTEGDTSGASINADGIGAKTAARLGSLGPNTGSSHCLANRLSKITGIRLWIDRSKALDGCDDCERIESIAFCIAAHIPIDLQKTYKSKWLSVL